VSVDTSLDLHGYQTTILRLSRLGMSQDHGVRDYCWNRSMSFVSHPGSMRRHPALTLRLRKHQCSQCWCNVWCVRRWRGEGRYFKESWAVACELKWVRWLWNSAVLVTGLWLKKEEFLPYSVCPYRIETTCFPSVFYSSNINKIIMLPVILSTLEHYHIPHYKPLDYLILIHRHYS
jgi:hypothetical protein